MLAGMCVGDVGGSAGSKAKVFLFENKIQKVLQVFRSKHGKCRDMQHFKETLKYSEKEGQWA